MSLPEKEYFSLREMERRWRIAREDTAYHAENGILELSIRTHGLDLEEGSAAQPDAAWGRRPEKRWRHDGLLALLPKHLASVFRRGFDVVAEFKAEPGRFLTICEPSRPMRIEPVDLVIARGEIMRVEREFGPFEPTETCVPSPALRLHHTADFSEIVRDGRTFRFRGVQANIVRHLHEAAELGTPWVAGKQLLRQAGSHSTRLVDVFKRHPDWRDLIESDGCGAYRLRLAIPETSEPSRTVDPLRRRRPA